MEGLEPEEKHRLAKIKFWYEEHGIEKPLTSVLDNGKGFALEVPNLVGSNIGAQVPIAFVVLGAEEVRRFKGLLDSPDGGVINGQIVYFYVGTIRPWALHIRADLQRVHRFISQHFEIGYYFAAAEIYDAVEKMRSQQIIDVTVWDENDKITTKYKPEQLFSKLVDLVVNHAFDFHSDIKPDMTVAKAAGKRGWWWSGSYSRRDSTVDVSGMIDVKITIHGKSDPIPVSTSLYLRVPSYATCNDVNLIHTARLEALKSLYTAGNTKLLADYNVSQTEPR
ncbi:MAG: hypothetical protein F4Y00_00840 [Bacteroidetes bacterium SB0662_bin_6]|nr:hypothetical protein [Bacteroidetes bacterium SB0662_bin_6]